MVEAVIPGISFRVANINHRKLCQWIGELPGVSFTRKPQYFWTGSGVCAEFTYTGQMFLLEADPWDGEIWVVPKDGLAHPSEIDAIRFQIEDKSSQNSR